MFNSSERLLTIITICKNEPFIKDTCESVVSQIDKDFEWIVMDWASTDGTFEILEEYKKNIDILLSEKDSGVYNAMNKWINLASWKYVLFLNWWDLLYNNEVILKVKMYLHEWKSDVYYGDSYRLFSDVEKCFIKTYPKVLTKNFFLTNTLAHQSSFIKKSLFDEFWMYSEDFKIVSDKEKWLCFVDNNVNFEYLWFVCSCFRMNGVSRNKSQLLKDEKIKMLKQYFSDDKLYNSDIPYLQELCDK